MNKIIIDKPAKASRVSIRDMLKHLDSFCIHTNKVN